MKKIRHSKYKNTGVLFELLTKQITYEILNNDSGQNAQKIVKEFFNSKTELSKELKLYNLLMRERYNSEQKAEKFIDAVLEARIKLNEDKISREKYNLVKKIKENFNINELFSSQISEYKVLASIHKLFEAKKQDIDNIKDTFAAKYTLIEHISSHSKNSKPVEDKLLEFYKKQDSDVRLLSHKILIQAFNKKYGNLSENQKILLREYINNVSNTSKFNDYYKQALKSAMTELNSLYTGVSDTVTRIKLTETINVLKGVKINDKKINDNQVSALMLVYELINEMKNVKKK